ncbi:PREDICTED: leucine-rich repeat-containing protein 31 [Nanorana parkeri]|uniref:leucine-rich repeat-containing protein 31 n=1 Tax=Nanorana parkeri TaxID=125878 RepID=UPI0008550755|nr:PREDICTED: leucine-rich repeat-containing protein 31 [Nanorana parkeri]
MDNKGSEKKKEGEGSKKSPFDLIFSQIQRKKSDKGKSSIFQVKSFFKGFDKDAAKMENEKNEEELNQKSISENQKSDSVVDGAKDEEDSDTSGWWKVTHFMEKFGKKADIHYMDLNNCELTAVDIKKLGSLMPFLLDIEEINLSWNDLIGGSLKYMTPHFNHVSRLRILNLSNCGLTGDDSAVLGESLQYIPKLQILDLSWNNNLGGTLSRLAQHLADNCEIKTLSLTECSLTAEDIESLAPVIGKMTRLEILDLSENKELGSKIKNLTEELKHCSCLNVLKLRSTGLHQDTVQYLSSAFQYWPYLRKLDLSCNKTAGGGFGESAVCLTAFKQLELLDIHQCCLSGDDVTALTQVIPLLSNLQALDISSNKTVGLSQEHLFSRLRFLPKLKSVNVSNCMLKKESFAGLAEATRYLTDLQMLDLSWNKCIGGNLKLLTETLHSANSLQSLLLSSCNLVTQDLAVLASAAQASHLDSLQQLDLAYNDTVPDEGWSLLFESVPALKNITELDISLRPASTRNCGPWFIHLLSNIPKLPMLKELGMQRWALSTAEQQQLNRIHRENNISIHFD